MKKKILSKKIIVFYHGDCTDGLCGAWAAWKKFKSHAEYIPLFREEPMPEVRGKEVYFIDFTPHAPELRRIISRNNRVTAIDHHITAEEAVYLTEAPSFSLVHSGAVLAWEYFHPNEKTPLLLRYVEDRDLWTWKLPHAEEILAGTNFTDAAKPSFEALSVLAKNFENPKYRKARIEDGKIVRSVWNSIIEELAGMAEKINFEGHKAAVINSPHMFASQLGNYLVKHGADIAIIWHVLGGNIKVSMRSGKNVDVAKIAEKYGGGGHRAASGFLLKKGARLPWEK